MKSVSNILIIACLVIFSTSCSNDSSEEFQATNQEVVVPESKIIEIEIMELINAYRISEGLTSLNNKELIKGQAYSHTDYMVMNDNVSHDNFYARKTYLVNNMGAQTVAENVAYGYSSAESVVNAWLNSAGHKQNIEGDYTDFEVSAEQNDQGKWYFTNIFVKK